MSTVVISPFSVVDAPGVGGHFWVYMHYAQALRILGCEVYWLEQFTPSGDEAADDARLVAFLHQMEGFGLRDRVLLYCHGPSDAIRFLTCTHQRAEDVFRRADMLLNFHYAITPSLLSRFRRTAFVDIDPGLLQFWVANRQIALPPHDYAFTIGETVGTPRALFSHCGIDWIHIRPAVCLEWWPYADVADTGRFTTVSSWWGAGGKGEFITDGDGLLYENNKRYSFLQFVELPRYTGSTLELALFLGDGETEEAPDESKRLLGRQVGQRDPGYSGLEMYRYTGDAEDRAILQGYGWQVVHSRDVAGTTAAYRSYVQQSRGEFSCAKPSCMRFQNAWVSDRSLCYLASGRPVVLQHTGESSFLPDAYGMFRFSDMAGAVEALATVESDYERQRRAARELAEEFFDAKKTVSAILNAVSRRPEPTGAGRG